MDYTHEFPYHKRKTDVRKTSLILLNDDVNDFDYVIDCLVLVCSHTPIQAEQSAVITHYTGRCVIKEGSFLDLMNLKKDLSLYGLNLEIR
ncbi:MAG: Clp protease ClpS [Flavobacteriales bacterium]|mgnify:CR=1 FL=1|nr:Clp protease ClpS [Flavobacteriales bacterium]|tara:strand:+ start:1431 stop:1700 length:270 start_codon:yes stop_codon:yes gene_type:complete